MQEIKQRLLQILETTDWPEDDRRWLLEYLDKNDTNALRQIIQQEFIDNTGHDGLSDDESARQLLELIHQKIKPAGATIFRMSGWKKAIAAAAILIVVAGALFLYNQSTEKDQPVASNKQPATDVAPGGNKAVLTLADGSVVVLDNAQNGTLSQQGNAKVLKLNDGQLAYNVSGSPLGDGGKEVLYNTVSTPRGGQYQMTLSDGSKVWLNAASSIKFPVAFSGSERKVEITGEAYFEVAKNAAMPFKVNVAGKQEVEVLGTHFNINAYSDEATVNTTLLEGKVKVTAVSNSQLLTPGQQAQLTANGQIGVNKNVDVDEVVAWKNGKFIFQDADIQSIMRQIERWYDVEVKFSGKITEEQFVGRISRNVNISQILERLGKTGAVKFEIEGRIVIVK